MGRGLCERSIESHRRKGSRYGRARPSLDGVGPDGAARRRCRPRHPMGQSAGAPVDRCQGAHVAGRHAAAPRPLAAAAAPADRPRRQADGGHLRPDRGPRRAPDPVGAQDHERRFHGLLRTDRSAYRRCERPSDGRRGGVPADQCRGPRSETAAEGPHRAGDRYPAKRFDRYGADANPAAVNQARRRQS